MPAVSVSTGALRLRISVQSDRQQHKLVGPGGWCSTVAYASTETPAGQAQAVGCPHTRKAQGLPAQHSGIDGLLLMPHQGWATIIR